MSWIQKLYETYEQTAQLHTEEKARPWPVAHFSKRAHVEIVIDESGTLRRIQKLNATESATLIPVTEASLGRAGSKIAPHPLCEETSYCAIDFPDGNKKKQAAYLSNLEKWCQSDQAHSKAKAVLVYLKRATLWADLLGEKIIPLVVEGARGKEKISDEKIFVRWRIEASDNLVSATWEDAALIESWAKYDKINNPKNGMCMVLGEDARIGNNHPKFIRHAGDGAKLISANDSSGFTFRGRFTDDTGQQACGVSYEVTQKAHNALRWLIQRQGHRYGDPKQPQVVVSWAVGGMPIPDPLRDSLFLLAGVEGGEQPAVIPDTDIGQAFAQRLNLALKGYRANLGPTDDIVVMGLDSATPGRMAITYYRELTGSAFLTRIERWHSDFAWHQNFGKDKHFIGAPAPHDIAEAAYGRRLDDKLKKATIERLLPCIVDGQALPRDLLESTIRRACNRVGLERWEWEKFLGIACGLYRGAFKNEGYEMALETDRRSRDYLYGRLLAVAEHIESRALYVAGEKRDTMASKLMQRFADRPASTWRIVEPALKPYISRLRAKRAGFMFEMDKLLDEIIPGFIGDDFLDDSKLSGEFLLGYHCQRQALSPPKPDAAATADEATPTD
ncbi:MAG: type I-C CRISPR-associated protein Cas8c/Csd1 [Sphingomonadales bacterium]|nr:type I-C CRISPR-associated protein Cas8c/Csd1 [Sphingomonadales bacterium]